MSWNSPKHVTIPGFFYDFAILLFFFWLVKVFFLTELCFLPMNLKTLRCVAILYKKKHKSTFSEKIQNKISKISHTILKENKINTLIKHICREQNNYLSTM